MKKKRIALIAAGITVLALSFAIPLVAVAMATGQGTGIIGGADHPTYWLLYRTWHLYFVTAIGTALTAVGILGK
jgi:hypothetical protein